jgi:hypothetical protein
MTLHDRKLIAQARKPRVPTTVFMRRRLLERRCTLRIQWDRLFPFHDFGTERLSVDLSNFERLCDEAERKAKPSNDIRRFKRLLDSNVSIERAWNEINDPRNRPTPQTVVETIMFCVRERGLAALKEPANIERLSRCDATAKAQIDQRIEKLIKREGNCP